MITNWTTTMAMQKIRQTDMSQEKHLPPHLQADIIHIESKIPRDRLKNLTLSSHFTRHGPYCSIFTQKQTLEHIAEKGGSITLALLDHRVIIGYAVLSYPDPAERWAKSGEGVAMELKAIEVVREFRNQGIGRRLLDRLFSDSELDEKIVYLTAYAWTWDLEHSGLSAQAYRNLLISLYTGVGFIACSTNEPNVCLRPENIFMVRVGKTVSQQAREKFKQLRFGILESMILTLAMPQSDPRADKNFDQPPGPLFRGP